MKSTHKRNWAIWLCTCIILLSITTACNTLEITHGAITPIATLIVGHKETSMPTVMPITPSPVVARGQPTTGFDTSTPSPIVATPQTRMNQIVYFLIAREYYEIWKLPRNGSQSDIIYQALPRKLSLASGEEVGLISQDTSDILRDKYARDPSPEIENADAIPLDVSMIALTLSPSKEYLAWKESYQWCPGNYCLGQHTIKIMRLDNGTLIVEIHTPEAFSAPVWSPDSQSLAFHETTRSVFPEIQTLWLVDVSTGKTNMIGEGLSPVWSPNSLQIASTFTDEPYEQRPTELMVISIEDGTATTVKPPTWNSFDNPTWSPDSDRLAFEGERIGSVGDVSRHSILIADMRTQEITELRSEPASFGVTRWSPDGRWIATTVSNENHTNTYDLMIIDAVTGQTVMRMNEMLDYRQRYNWSPDGRRIAALLNDENTYFPDLVVVNVITKDIEFQVTGVHNWQWASDGSEILFVGTEANDPLTQQIQVIDILSGGVYTFDLPDLVDEFLRSFGVVYSFPISVTW